MQRAVAFCLTPEQITAIRSGDVPAEIRKIILDQTAVCPVEEKFLKAAQAHATDELEVDDVAVVSINDEGDAWVGCWIFIRKQEIGQENDD